MATVSAQPVFRLLGAKDLGVTEDYRTAKMPPVNTGLLNGQLAWRQHDGGHTDAPNWKHFIPWADKFLDYRSVPWQFPADQPVFRTDPNSLVAHAQLLAKAAQGGIDVYFEGDSIARRWGATDYPELLANWKRNFYGWNAGDFGWGADRTQNILWRLENGELDAVNPKVVVLLAGTNNVGDPSFPGDADAKAEDVTRGLEAIVRMIREKAPATTIVVMGIFPRNDNMALMPVIERINGDLARSADGRTVRYLNINGKFAGDDGKLFEGMMNAQDKLHPTVKGYQVWADALKPVLTELLGPPSVSDHAPPFRSALSYLPFCFRNSGRRSAAFSRGERRSAAPGSRQAFPHPRRRTRQLVGRDGDAGRYHTARDGATAPEHGTGAGCVGTGGAERRGFGFQHSGPLDRHRPPAASPPCAVVVRSLEKRVFRVRAGLGESRHEALSTGAVGAWHADRDTFDFRNRDTPRRQPRFSIPDGTLA